MGNKVLKSFSITDLFYITWEDLTTEEMYYAFQARQEIYKCKKEGNLEAAGHGYIMLLQQLRKNKSAVAQMNVEQVVDCVNDILFPESPEQVRKSNLKKTPLFDPWYFFPPISHPLCKTPGTHLKDRSFVQLVYADSFFSKFFIQDYYDKLAYPPHDPSPMSEAYLNDMISVLYTSPANFKEQEIENRSETIGAHLNDYERAIILHTYANVKEFIIDGCPTIFFRPEETEEDKPRVPIDSEPMWQDLLFDLSETPAYQGMDAGKSAPIYEALNYLEKKAKSNKPKQQNA